MPTPARLARRPRRCRRRSGSLGELARRQPGTLASVIALLCEAEVALSPEDELELDALVRQVGDAAQPGRRERGSPLHALSFWLMKRRAGQVGERLGRELLAPAVTALGDAGAAGASDRPLLRGEARDLRGARRRAPRHPGAAAGRVLGVRLRGGCAGHEAPGLLPPRARGADGGRARSWRCAPTTTGPSARCTPR